MFIYLAKDYARMNEAKKEMKKIKDEHGFKFRNMLIPMAAQIPGFIVFFMSLRYMLSSGFYPELATGSLLSLLCCSNNFL